MNDPCLLTPGPLTTSMRTKQAMLHDWGSRDLDFIATNKHLRRRLADIAGAGESHVCVPIQGSGTFAIEASLGTLIAANAKALILINGAYGRRIAKIMDYMGRPYTVYETSEDTPPAASGVAQALSGDPSISHVVVVHCETTSGILNPVEEIAQVVSEHRRELVIDAMSSFGAIPLDGAHTPFAALVASSNKCLEGVPGMGFSIIRKDVIKAAGGNAHSLSLDLHDQWRVMEETGQWRFTPPTHVIAALDAALDQFAAAGGLEARHARYAGNCAALIKGMRGMGFRTLVADDIQAPIIVTFLMPGDDNFDFRVFYDRLKEHGYVIYPGKLTVADTFRVGCIGDIGEAEIEGALKAVSETLGEMGVADGKPRGGSF